MVFFLKPLGHFGFEPVIFLTNFPFIHVMVIFFAFGETAGKAGISGVIGVVAGSS